VPKSFMDGPYQLSHYSRLQNKHRATLIKCFSSGATVIPGAMFIPESRVLPRDSFARAIRHQFIELL
jgi:hypothetical protein